MSSDASWVWYFAYGSNLDPRTFLGRRRMRPRDTRRGRLDGYALRFDLPVGPGERGVANVRADAEAHVDGVAYEITREQADFLDRTEGVPHGAYARIDVRIALDDSSSLAAFTYASERGDAGRRPSRRYLGLLLHGARHHELDAAWIAWLRSLPLAVDERETQQELFDGS